MTITAAPSRTHRPGASGDGAAEPTRPLAGTALLLRLVLRRDRFRLVLWVAGIVALVLVSAGSVEGLYQTPEDLASYASLARDNAAIVVQAGPGYGLDDPTVGAILMNETAIWTVLAVALMSVLMITRHTRAEEETERADLVRSAPVGRHAGSVAAMAGVLLAVVAVAVGVTVGLAAFGYELVGSVAFGVTLVGAGAVFAAIALVTAQLAASPRAATGLAVLVIGLAFVLRAVGDVAENGLSWLSPIGWAQAIRAFAGERWWVLAVPAAATVGLVMVAVELAARRDVGGGVLTERPGPAEAGPGLSSPLGLAVRLHRASVVAWAVGVGILGVFYGIVANEAERMIEENPDLADFFALLGTASITDAFLATSVLMAGLLTGGFAVAAVLRLRSEETVGRADPLLATPVTRSSWAASHLVVTLVGTIVVLVSGGVGTGFGAAAAMGEPARIGELAGAALVMVPAPLVLAAVAFALVGVAPRWSLLAWLGLVVAVVVGLLAEVLDLPGWARDLSPFQHTPALPAAPLRVFPVAVLLVVAAALVVVGLVGLRRRDINRT
jgi:ABC-2 type transport system permease protein